MSPQCRSLGASVPALAGILTTQDAGDGLEHLGGVCTRLCTQGGAVPVVPQCPHVHIDSRGIWACCALEREQEKNFIQNPCAPPSFTSMAV